MRSRVAGIACHEITCGRDVTLRLQMREISVHDIACEQDLLS